MRRKIDKQYVRAASKLLIKYKLMKFGIESSDGKNRGIDLIVHSTKRAKISTIQILTRREPELGGGKGKLSIGWKSQGKSPAEFIALVDLSSDRAWLLTKAEYHRMAQQRSATGVYNLYMYLDERVATKKKMALISQFNPYLIENRISMFF